MLTDGKVSINDDLSWDSLNEKLVDEMTENSTEVTSETQKVGFIDPTPY